MSLIMKVKHGGKFTIQPMPPIEQLTAAALMSWQGKPCVIEFDDGSKKLYAYGNAAMRGAWEEGKIVMDMESFAHFFKYHMLNYGLDLFTRLENTEERIAICEAEKVAPEEIAAILASQPTLYATEEMRHAINQD